MDYKIYLLIILNFCTFANIRCLDSEKFVFNPYEKTINHMIETNDSSEFDCLKISKNPLRTPLFCSVKKIHDEYFLIMKLLRQCVFYNHRDHDVIINVNDHQLLVGNDLKKNIVVKSKSNATFSIIETDKSPVHYLRDISLFKGSIYFTKEHELRVYRPNRMEGI